MVGKGRMLVLNIQEGRLATKGGLRIKLLSYSSDLRGPQHLVGLAEISGHNLIVLNSLTSSSIPISQKIFPPKL